MPSNVVDPRAPRPSDEPDGSKPLVLLDVDGPLNPFRRITRNGHLPVDERPGEQRYTFDKHLMRPAGWESGDPLPVLLSREMGADLAALTEVADLVWATTWVEDANILIGPALGLPDFGIDRLPVIAWPPDPARHTVRFGGTHRGSWKTVHILAWLDALASRVGHRVPWAWLDDDIAKADRRAVREHYDRAHRTDQTDHDHPTDGPWSGWRLHRIEPSHGLRRGDLADLRAWATERQPPA